MFAIPAARGRRLEAAPPWVYLGLLSSAVLALIALGLLVIVLPGAQPAGLAGPTSDGGGPPNVVARPEPVLARVALPDHAGGRVGGPGGDPGPSPAPAGGIEGAIAGAVPMAAIVLVTAVLAAAVGVLAMRARYGRRPRARLGPPGTFARRG